MTATAKGGGSRKRAAASAEKTGKPKKIEWRGKTLTGPAELPPAFELDVARIEGQAQSGASPLGSIYLLLVSIVGEDGYGVIRDEVAANGASNNGDGESALMKAFEEIVSEYGTTAGESSASATS